MNLTPSLSIPGQIPRGIAAAALAGLLLVACQPTVKVETPQEPITINLNIKLDADVRLKIEEQAEETIESNPELF
jgi:hypothetical protein